MSIQRLVERIDREIDTVKRLLERVKKIERDDGDITNMLDDLKTLNYGIGVLAGFDIVLTMIRDLEVEA